MPLQFQAQQAPLKFGLSEGVDPHQVPFGTLTTAENVRWEKSGRAEKRFGTANLSMAVASGGVVDAQRLITRGTELAAVGQQYLYSYNSTNWTVRGRVPEVRATWETNVSTVDSVAACDAVKLSNNTIVEAWVTGEATENATSAIRKLFYQVRDPNSGATIVSPTQILMAGAPSPKALRLVAVGSTWFVLYITAGKVYAGNDAGTTYLSNIGSVTSTTDAASLDALAMSNGQIIIAASLAAGGVRIARYSVSGSLLSYQTYQDVPGETNTDIRSISLAGDSSESLYVVYARQRVPGLRYCEVIGSVHDPSTLAQNANVVIQSLSANYNPGYPFAATVACTRRDSTSIVVVYTICYPGAPGPATTTTYAGWLTYSGTWNYLSQHCTGLRVVSRPFALGSRFYCVMATDMQWLVSYGTVSTKALGSNCDTFLVDVTQANVASTSIDFAPAFRNCAKLETLIGACWFRGFVSSSISGLTTGQIMVPVPYQKSVVSGATGFDLASKLIKVNHAYSASTELGDLFRSVDSKNETYISSGVLTAYDGNEPLGYGFPFGPYIDEASTSSVSGAGSLASTTSETYWYTLTSERKGFTGILHRAPISQAKKIDLTYSASFNNYANDVYGFVPSFGQGKNSFGVVGLFRTVNNGTIPQRISFSSITSPVIKDSAAIYGASTNSSVLDGYVDGYLANGGTLTSQAAIYTAGGELEDMQPPSGLTLTFFQSRLWMLAGDQKTVWVSKDSSANPGVAPGFHPSVTLTFDKTLTALCPLDDKLIAFAGDSFFAVYGQGPAPNGAGSTWEITAVQTDVGCINARSVASLPMGIIFQSARGLHLVSRNLEVQWVGSPVKDQLAAYPNITSAVVVSSCNEVRFTANNTGNTAGIVLVWNYALDAWSTWKYTVGGTYGAALADAILWNGTYTVLSRSGQVFTEDATTYLDGGSTWVPMTLETAWVSAGGPLAYQSVRRFSLEGVSNSNHDLTVSAAFNSSSTYAQSSSWIAGSGVTAVGSFETLDFQIGNLRKCAAIRFKIQDATPTNPGTYPVGTGQGPSIDMMGMEVGMKPGLLRKPDTKAG